MRFLHDIDDAIGSFAAGLLARLRARTGRNARHLMRDLSAARAILYLLLVFLSWNPLVTAIAAVLIPFEIVSWNFNGRWAQEIETPAGHAEEIARTASERVRLFGFRMAVLVFDALAVVRLLWDAAQSGPERTDYLMFDGTVTVVALLWTVYVYAGMCPPPAPGRGLGVGMESGVATG
jgi:hypothetical protein